jgi:hypothetical protein
MRKKTLATIIFGLIVSLTTGIYVGEVAKANFGPTFYLTPHESPPIIAVGSPLNQTYRKSSLNFSFNVTEPSNWFEFEKNSWGGASYFNGIYQTSLVTVSYSLDNNTLCLFDNSDVFISRSAVAKQHMEFSLVLGNLSEGSHKLEISASGRGYFTDTLYTGTENIGNIANSSSTINFFINTIPLCVPILFLENKTYTQNQIPLNFSINETASEISYSIDNQLNTTIAGNVTLTGLSEGSHSIVVYANDTAGNMGKSDAIFFTIDNSTPSPPPTEQPTLEPTPPVHSIPSQNFSLIITIVSIVLVIAAIASAVVYFKKIRK